MIAFINSACRSGELATVSQEQAATIAQLPRGVIYFPDSNVRAMLDRPADCLLLGEDADDPDGVGDPEESTLEQIRSLTQSAKRNYCRRWKHSIANQKTESGLAMSETLATE